MLLYSGNEHNAGYPRTKYDPTQHLQLDNAGFGIPETFGNKGYVGDNNVPASLFLLLKNQGLPAATFICPSADGQPGFTSSDPKLSSNWELIPLNLSYSMATPFPTAAAVKAGFVWRAPIPADFALAADINPGTRGGTNPPNNSAGPSHDASGKAMAAANSNNHRNQGQNVLYGDGRVEYSTTPYCGMPRPAVGFRDNIYTAGAGDGGSTSDTALPVDDMDSVLLPTDDPGGK
jgi:hypothetical protein